MQRREFIELLLLAPINWHRADSAQTSRHISLIAVLMPGRQRRDIASNTQRSSPPPRQYWLD